MQTNKDWSEKVTWHWIEQIEEESTAIDINIFPFRDAYFILLDI